MTITAESQKTIDTYLAALRKQLRGPVDEDVEDIVEEIRAHILDKTSGPGATDTVAATLASLGTPEELASRYRTDDLLQRAQVTRSPFVSLRSLFRWATLSFVGLTVFLVSVCRLQPWRRPGRRRRAQAALASRDGILDGVLPGRQS